MRLMKFLIPLLVIFFGAASDAASSDKRLQPTETLDSYSLDRTTYIDANDILMFVTNVANFGRDIEGLFGYSYGTWWPYCGDTFFISHNIDGAGELSPLYQAGLWLGGIDSATGEIRIVISDFGNEYVPGPMHNGSFLPDDPSFRNYKLYRDSLEGHPNQDYLDWPEDQGAPVDESGKPAMLGRQMLWSVCNDADPDAHTNDGGETEPLGVEVQQTVWAFWDIVADTLSYPGRVEVIQHGSTGAEVSVHVVDYEIVTGHDYYVVIDSGGIHQPVWDLIDETLGQTLLDDRPLNTEDTIDGLVISVTGEQLIFESFQVVANAGGVLDPPDAGALAFAGFPVPTERDPNGYPTVDQQITDFPYDVYWGIHTEDNGGSSGGGTNASYEAFLNLVTRNGANNEAIGSYDYEMRFTGTNDNPGTSGSYAAEWPESNHAFWVPFELWRTGIGTPDDPSDDIRLVPYIFDPHAVSLAWMGDDKFQLDNWGSSADGSCVLDCEHSCSGGDNDPWTDRVFWNMPVDSTPGESGYIANEASMLAGTFDGSLVAYEILARTVLVSWNGGVGPPFAMDAPELGTFFRILTEKTIPRDTFEFATSQSQYVVDSLEGASVYIRYKLYNKGENTINDMYIGLWTDPDLGRAGDDLVGCDTLDDIMFCYNTTDSDDAYGECPPALGFKLLEGPVVPSPGDLADFDGLPLPDHRNLGMTAFAYFIGGDDPDNSEQTYSFLQGLRKLGDPYVYEGDTLTYRRSGDPVQGVGDVDMYPADRRMMASSGPFDFRPGDSQFVLIKMSVARGPDHLHSITAVKAILNADFDPLTDTTGNGAPPLPSQYWVSQNYPNPFNPNTTIDYYLSQRARVTVDVYNILGQKIRRLRDRVQPAGEYRIHWDGTDANGSVVATGLYFYRFKAGDLQDTKKMVLLK